MLRIALSVWGFFVLGKFFTDANARRFSSVTGIMSFEWASSLLTVFPFFLSKVEMAAL